MISALAGDTVTQRYREREDGYMKMGSEMKILLLQARNAKDHWQPPETRKRQERILPLEP